MRKRNFLLGVGVGFVLGSRAGRGPYQQVESKVREVMGRSEVQDTVQRLKQTAKDQTSAVAGKVGMSKPQPQTVPPPDPPGQTYADPQDLRFSAAASEKQEKVDELLDQGLAPDQVEQQEQPLRESGELSEPRAGNKP